MKDRAHLDAFGASLQSCKEDCAYSQFVHALLLLEEPIGPNDGEEAVAWLTKAADTGYTEAHAQLGIMYNEGIGVAKNPQLALKWFKKPSEEGYCWAQHCIGELLMEQGGEANIIEAMAWFRKAAALGHAEAKEMLKKLGDNA